MHSAKIQLLTSVSLIILAPLALFSAGPAQAQNIRAPGKATAGVFSPETPLALPVVGPVPCDEATGLAGPFPCKNVDLLGYIPANVFGGFTTADIWGWTDPETGREYALVSHSMATSFVDVSDPVNPVLVGELLAPVPNVLWRDVKVYKDHAYIVGDGDFVLPHGIQVFDLTQLRGLSGPPVVFEATARYLGVGNTHNFAINEDTGTGFAVGSNTCRGGLHMIDLNNPPTPTFLGCFSGDGYTHDVLCVIYHGPDAEHQGREICVASNEDTLTIVDVTDKANPVMLARQGYAGHGYTHQGDFTDDHAFFILGDELDEMNNGHNTRSYLWDLTDLDAPVHFATYTGPSTSIDHNLFIVGDYVFESNYTSGLRILDNSEITVGVLTEVAFFDTHPASDVAGFAGAWSSYPYFASGIVIVSNIEDGLYILKPDLPGFPAPPASDVQATGGGWLATAGQKKINFGFDVDNTGGKLAGEIQFNDRNAGVKIHITTLTGLKEGSAACGSLTPGERVAELTGDGYFNGGEASFRVCVSDNGGPRDGGDGLFLECTTGCAYTSVGSALDNTIDGGNIQVSVSPNEPAGDSEPATLILDPVLLTEGVIGQLQTFTVHVYDQDQQPLAGVEVSLTRTSGNGSVTVFSAVTDLTGTAVFTVLNLAQPVELVANAGEAESNPVQIEPLLK
ncbi:MAG TPA: choice-of-anchor B family protein [Anaerolineales bacterium]|nr:choice-of-anchor B family protein [Anaerolineales bacterium]